MPNNSVDTNLETLKQVLNITFNRNLAALEKHFPNFFHRFKDYTPTEFALEMDNQGHLNIASKEGFLYDNDPQKVCVEQVDAFAKCPIRSVYNLSNIDPENAVVRFEHIDFIHEIVQKGEQLRAQEELKTLGEDTVYEAPDCYPFMCVIGVGIGYHLEHLSKEEISQLYIYEPHNDVFYASMFVIDYSSIFSIFTQNNKAITLEIGSSPEAFTESLHRNFVERGLYRAASMPVYKHYSNKTADRALNMFFDQATKYYSGFGFFEDEIISIDHTVRNLKAGLPVVPKVLDWLGEEDKPVFICGNGPSLDTCIEFLQKNRDKYYLFSCGSALSPLHKAGLLPDLHFETERTSQLYDWVTALEDEEYFAKVTLIAMNPVAPDVISLFGKAFLYMKPNDGATELMREAYLEKFNDAMYPFGSNPVVGNSALAFTAFAGFKKIYLAGLDAGYKEQGYHHSKDSAYYGKFKESFTLKEQKLKKVKGNFSEHVYTNFILDASRHALEYVLARPDFSDIECFNCSDGVFIEGATPQPIDEVNLSEFERKDLTEILFNQSLKGYFDVDLLEQKLLQCSKEMFEMMETIAPKELAAAQPTLQQLIDLYAYQFNHNRGAAMAGKIFAARMLGGSINYLQAPTVGKIFLLHTNEARLELAHFALGIFFNYFEKMKKLYIKNVLSDFSDKQIRSVLKK